MSENFNLSSATCVFDKLNSLLKYQIINRSSLFPIYCNKNNLSYYLYKIFFDKLIYKIIAFSIFCFVCYNLNSSYAQLYYLFYFALFVIYCVSFFILFFFFFFFDMSNIAKTGVFTKGPNIVDFDIYWNIENIFVEREKEKLVKFLNK